MLKRLHRTTNQEPEVALPLSLLTVDGKPMLTFPPEVVDSVRYMVTRLNYREALPPRLALVSPLRQEGVTYLSRALAAILANDLDVKVCVVELNWWWPDSSLDVGSESGGLAAVLNGTATVKSAIVRTGQRNVAILPAGRVSLKQRPILARNAHLKEIVDNLGQIFNYLILDIPAVLATNDAVPLVSLADACCLVVNQGVTSFENVRLALDEIDHLQVAGVVMNKVRTKSPAWMLKFIPQDQGPLASS